MNHDRSGGITHDLGFKFSNTAALVWRPLAGTGWVTALAVNADDQIVMGAVTLGVVVDPTAGTVGIGDVDGGAVVVEVEADGDVQIGDQTGDLVIDIDDAGNLGFFATTPAVAQQTLTASGDAARLTEVIGALENLGLVVDSTTPGAGSYAAGVLFAGVARDGTGGTWIRSGCLQADSADVVGTRHELEVFGETGNASYAFRARLWNVTDGEQVGDEITTTATTTTRLAQAIVLPSGDKLYRIEYQGTAGGTAVLSGARLQQGSDAVSLAFGTVTEWWPGLYVQVPLTVTSGVPWAITANGRTISTGTGTGSAQTPSVYTPILYDEAAAIVLTAGGSVTDTLGVTPGGPSIVSVQSFGDASHDTLPQTVSVAISDAPNRRVLVGFCYESSSSVGGMTAVTLDSDAMANVTSDRFVGSSLYSYLTVYEILEAALPVAAGNYDLVWDVGGVPEDVTNMTIRVIELRDCGQGAVVDPQEAEGSDTAPTDATTTSGDDALVLQFVGVDGTVASSAVTAAIAVASDYADHAASTSGLLIAARRAASAGAQTVTWTLGTSRAWGTSTFSLAGA